ncbi:hypothetical protein NLL20_27355, partial [Klebsiella quasipneumoniae]|nr:hypothetical protein [Klebsiella quasipneumoniae]
MNTSSAPWSTPPSTYPIVATVMPPARAELHMCDLRHRVRLHVGTQVDPFPGDGGTYSPGVAVQDSAVVQHVARLGLVGKPRHRA